MTSDDITYLLYQCNLTSLVDTLAEPAIGCFTSSFLLPLPHAFDLLFGCISGPVRYNLHLLNFRYPQERSEDEPVGDMAGHFTQVLVPAGLV